MEILSLVILFRIAQEAATARARIRIAILYTQRVKQRVTQDLSMGVSTSRPSYDSEDPARKRKSPTLPAFESEDVPVASNNKKARRRISIEDDSPLPTGTPPLNEHEADFEADQFEDTQQVPDQVIAEAEMGYCSLRDINKELPISPHTLMTPLLDEPIGTSEDTRASTETGPIVTAPLPPGTITKTRITTTTVTTTSITTPDGKTTMNTTTTRNTTNLIGRVKGPVAPDRHEFTPNVMRPCGVFPRPDQVISTSSLDRETATEAPTQKQAFPSPSILKQATNDTQAIYDLPAPSIAKADFAAPESVEQATVDSLTPKRAPGKSKVAEDGTPSFEDRIVELKEYYNEHGHLRVPQCFTDGRAKSLGLWVKGIRQVHGYCFSKEKERPGIVLGPNKLSQLRIKRLEAMGFEWSLQQQKGQLIYSLKQLREPFASSPSTQTQNSPDLSAPARTIAHSSDSWRTREASPIYPPHPHDVLLGQGRNGAIHDHSGNVLFRAWVSDRKTNYDLACSDDPKKALIVQEVIDLVQKQTPPGRFLKLDPIGGSYIKLDNGKVTENIRHAMDVVQPISTSAPCASPTSPATQAEAPAQAPPSSFTPKQSTNENQAISPVIAKADSAAPESVEQATVDSLTPKRAPGKSTPLFEDRIVELQEYYNEHGHLRVPHGYTFDRCKGLGLWVSDIRQAYQRCLIHPSRMGKESPGIVLGLNKLSKLRIERLEAMGFKWSVQQRKGQLIDSLKQLREPFASSPLTQTQNSPDLSAPSRTTADSSDAWRQQARAPLAPKVSWETRFQELVAYKVSFFSARYRKTITISSHTLTTPFD
jgi:hypothetical protein